MNKRVIIDYLSVTFPLNIQDNDEYISCYETLRFFREYFGLKRYECKTEDYATNNFKYQFTLSQYITLRCCGPFNANFERTCHLEMKGEGCREFERIANGKTWLDLFKFLYGLDPVFKRIDITIDDFDGCDITMADIFEKSKKRLYTSVFKSKPTYHGILEDGLTIDFGSRTSSTELCIYDKKRQQERDGIKIPEKYWVRYEIRFRGAKADAIVLDLVSNYEDKDDKTYELKLQDYAQKALYATIDFKVDNNYSESDQSKAETDPRWKTFVNDIDKAKLPKAVTRPTLYEKKRAYIMPKAALVLTVMLIEKNWDGELFLHDLLNDMHHYLTKFSQHKEDVLNICLDENGLETFGNGELYKIREKIYEMIIDMELPF